MEKGMLFPNISTEEWITKHSGLKKATGICRCGRTLVATIPFISKGYIGLTSSLCSCGSPETKVESAIPRTDAERRSWDSALGYL